MIKCNLTARAKTGILWALAHHASAVRPVVLELLAAFYLSDVDGVHDVGRKNGRQNSYIMFGGKRYYFRWNQGVGGNAIEVRTSFRGPVKWSLATRADALRWLRVVGIA